MLEWVRDMNKYRYDSDHQAHFGKHAYISESQKEHIWARMLRTDLVFRIWGIWHTNELLTIQRIQELNPFWSALPLSLHCHIPKSFQFQLFEIMHVQISPRNLLKSNHFNICMSVWNPVFACLFKWKFSDNYNNQFNSTKWICRRLQRNLWKKN
jgi:hypothetical protein